jgi:hypothetical protein
MSHSKYGQHLTIFLTTEQRETVVQQLRDSNRFIYPAYEMLRYKGETNIHPIEISYYMTNYICSCRVSNDERRKFIKTL